MDLKPPTFLSFAIWKTKSLCTCFSIAILWSFSDTFRHSDKKQKESWYSWITIQLLIQFYQQFWLLIQGMNQNSNWWGGISLATFCCYDCGANTSEAFEKIAIDHKDYHKCFLCYILLHIESISWITVKKFGY